MCYNYTSGDNMNNKNCPNCGAPITTEICPYCNVMTGLDTKHADMEYPVIDCKEANVGFWTFIFPLIFAFAFGIPGIIFPIVFLSVDSGTFGFMILIFILPLILGLVAFIIAMKPIVRYLSIKINGKEIDATVYGYMDDIVIMNGNPAQIVKLLVQTNDGPKFILYQLGDIKQPFKINSNIKLRVYKDIFLIENKKQYYFE